MNGKDKPSKLIVEKIMKPISGKYDHIISSIEEVKYVDKLTGENLSGSFQEYGSIKLRAHRMVVQAL